MPHPGPRCPRAAHVRAVLGTVAAVIALAACGPVDPDTVTPTRFVDPPTVSPSATQAYGDRAEQAFEQATELLLTQSYVPALVDPQHPGPTPADLTEGIVEAMAPGAAQAWVALVERDLAGDEGARDAVRLLRFHSWEATGARLATPQDPVAFQTITDGEVDLGTDDGDTPSLVVSLVHRTGITLVEDRVPYEVVLTTPLTLTLTPDPGSADRWLIASFEGTLAVEVDGEPVPGS